MTRTLSAHARVVLAGQPAQGMSSAVAARTYEPLAAAGLHACAVIAEQRLPPALRGRPTSVHELHRGAVVFAGEAGEPGRRI